MEKYFTKEDLKNAYDESLGNGYYDNGINFEDYFNQLKNVGKEMFSKEDVQNILKEFVKENSTTPKMDIELVDEFIEEYIKDNSPKEIVEELIPITYSTIKNTCGWTKWCDVTNGEYWSIREFGEYDNNHILYCTKSQFQKLF